MRQLGEVVAISGGFNGEMVSWIQTWLGHRRQIVGSLMSTLRMAAMGERDGLAH